MNAKQAEKQSESFLKMPDNVLYCEHY